jgi:hypothetical protein
MAIVTAQDMYTAVLDGIFKSKTGTLYPDEFERLINKTQLEYVQNKLTQEEENQKRTDDLREIRVLSPDIPPSSLNTFPLPYSAGNKPPGYLYLLAANFKLNYINNVCGLTGVSGYLMAKTMKSDWNENELMKDPYNRPKDDKLYFKVIGDNVILITGTNSTGAFMQIDYYRYPRDISVTSSIDCELAVHVRQEIVDIAIRKYLQEVQDPRYQTKAAEAKSELL